MPIEFLLLAGDQATNTSLPAGTQITVSLVTRAETTRQLITVGGMAKNLGGAFTPTDTAITGVATTWNLVVPNDLTPGMVTAFKLDTGTLIDSGYRIHVTTILPGGCGSSSVCWSPPTDGCNYGNECSFPS